MAQEDSEVTSGGREINRERQAEIRTTFRELERHELGKSIVLRGPKSVATRYTDEPGPDAYVIPSQMGIIPAYPLGRVETEHLVLCDDGRMVLVALPQTDDPEELKAYFDTFVRDPRRYFSTNFAHPGASYSPPPDIDSIDQLLDSFGWKGYPSENRQLQVDSGATEPSGLRQSSVGGLITHYSMRDPRPFPGYIDNAVNLAGRVRGIQDHAVRSRLGAAVRTAFPSE